jgi:hypothetical protein
MDNLNMGLYLQALFGHGAVFTLPGKVPQTNLYICIDLLHYTPRHAHGCDYEHHRPQLAYTN